jgi:hypothetical protein
MEIKNVIQLSNGYTMVMTKEGRTAILPPFGAVVTVPVRTLATGREQPLRKNNK